MWVHALEVHDARCHHAHSHPQSQAVPHLHTATVACPLTGQRHAAGWACSRRATQQALSSKCSSNGAARGSSGAPLQCPQRSHTGKSTPRHRSSNTCTGIGPGCLILLVHRSVGHWQADCRLATGVAVAVPIDGEKPNCIPHGPLPAIAVEMHVLQLVPPHGADEECNEQAQSLGDDCIVVDGQQGPFVREGTPSSTGTLPTNKIE